jgi:hypothetical protein
LENLISDTTADDVVDQSVMDAQRTKDASAKQITNLIKSVITVIQKWKILK